MPQPLHRSTVRRLVLLLSLIIGIVPSFGQTDVSSTGTLYLKFLDSRSSAAVAPRTLSVNGAPLNFQVEAGSLVAIPLPDGAHTLTVEAENYKTFEFAATVKGDETPVMEIELDASQNEETPEIEAGYAVLEGFVTDIDTGSLIRGATISLPDASMTTSTDETGQFFFTLQVPHSTENSRAAVNLEAWADNYRPQRIKNMAVVSGERRRMPIKLERSTSDTQALDYQEQDEAAPDGPLRTYEWTFDVTIR